MRDCGDVCANLDIDPSNCGECGSECRSDDICEKGTCKVDCESDETDCDGVCVDFFDDDPHRRHRIVRRGGRLRLSV